MRNCDCIEKTQVKLSEKLDCPNIDREMLSGKTYSKVYYSGTNKKGKRKREETNLLHSYCPWCGVKYDKEA